MDEHQERLANCFHAVFPELSAEEILLASSTSVKSWDSTAVVTLLALIEEEFGIIIEDDDVARFDSFSKVLAYLQETGQQR